MENLWRQFKSLFQSVEESNASHPVVHELLVRSEKDLMGLQAWGLSSSCEDFLQRLSGQYFLWLSLPDEKSSEFDFLNTPSSKGFAFHFHQSDFDKNNAGYLFDYLKERVLTQGYKAQISDTRAYLQTSGVETLDRHYLKPRTSLTKGSKINQGFGNVLIELLSRNSVPHTLKFQVNTYQDHLFQEAGEFSELLDLITT